MSDQQLAYQADCFDKHGDELPVELVHELRVRNHRFQAMADARAEVQAERNFGA